MDNWGCGGFVGGKTALSQYEDEFFITASVTYWERGTNQGIAVAFKLE